MMALLPRTIMMRPCLILTLLLVCLLQCCAQKSQYTLSLSCPNDIRESIRRCETDNLLDWDVRDVDSNTAIRKFCCYIWNTLDCEVYYAQKCDQKYASDLTYFTEQMYGSMCEFHSRRSLSCALRWWSVMLIILALLFIIAIVGFVIYRKRQSKKTHEYDTSNRKLDYLISS